MVNKLLFLFLFAIFSFAKDSDIYELNCVECHDKLPVSIDKYFYKYLLEYSGETEVKKAMFEYLKNPTIEKTIMAEPFVTRFGIKKKTKLSDVDLKKALDTYWEEYKLHNKLK